MLLIASYITGLYSADTLEKNVVIYLSKGSVECKINMVKQATLGITEILHISTVRTKRHRT